MAAFTPWVFLWETKNGDRQWEVIGDKQMSGFLKKLVKENKINLATVMAARMPIGFNYAWERFHNDHSSVNFGKLNETIYGSESPADPPHKPVQVREEKPKPESNLGWLAPDGRFFACEYGGHTPLAIRIVGEMVPVLDCERYLEEHGWAKIYRDPLEHRNAVGMGATKTLTDAQLKALTRMQLDHLPEVSTLLGGK